MKALEGRGAALIANHGLVAVGPRPDKVLHITALVERTAQIVWGARALGGPVPIPEEVNANFAGVYGYLRANPNVVVGISQHPFPWAAQGRNSRLALDGLTGGDVEQLQTFYSVEVFAVASSERQVKVHANTRLQAIGQPDVLASASQCCGQFARTKRTAGVEREGPRVHQSENVVTTRQKVCTTRNSNAVIAVTRRR